MDAAKSKMLMLDTGFMVFILLSLFFLDTGGIFQDQAIHSGVNTALWVGFLLSSVAFVWFAGLFIYFKHK